MNLTKKGIEKMRVLLVEDNMMAQKIAQSLLVDLGCQVDTADCGMQGVDLFEKTDYQLVFVDIGLPDISGFDVIKKIKEKAQHNTHYTSITVLTAHAEQEELQTNSSNILWESILSKPLTREKAIRLIDNHLAHNKKNPIKTDDAPLFDVAIIQEDASDELLSLLEKSIPLFRIDIEKAYQAHDFNQLSYLAHKMHGGVCYTNTPHLLQAIKALDEILQKNNVQQLSAAYHAVCVALDMFEKAYLHKKRCLS